MKLIATFLAATLGLSQAFTVVPSGSTATSSTSLAAMADRRAVLKTVATAAAAVAVAAPLPAFAEYEPKVDDLKQIYFLGASLDKLVDKLANPDTLEAGLDGVRMFNKDPDFYPGYAKNFISKTVKKSADADPRVGYIKQVRIRNVCAFSEFVDGLCSQLSIDGPNTVSVSSYISQNYSFLLGFS